MGTRSEDIPVVVVGVGHLGQHHARLFKEVPGARLVGVVDANPEQAKKIAGPLDVPVFDTLADIPGEVRAASVAVPTSLHHEVSSVLLERGLHVLVEKPLAASLVEARDMEQLSLSRGLVLQVGHIERFNPALSALSQLDVQPRFIESHRLAPFNYRTLDVSVVMDLMIHDIDIVMALADAPVTGVDAVGSRVLGHHVDIANARLNFGNGCVANVTASRVSFEPMRRTRVFGDETFVSMDFGSRRAFVLRKAEGFDLGSLDFSSQQLYEPKETFKEFVSQGLMTMRQIDMDEANPLLSELTAFIANVQGREAPGVSARQGLRAMEVAEEITASIMSHRWT